MAFDMQKKKEKKTKKTHRGEFSASAKTMRSAARSGLPAGYG